MRREADGQVLVTARQALALVRRRVAAGEDDRLALARRAAAGH